MPTPEQLSHWDSHHTWHSFTQMAEYDSVVIERGEGVWLYDVKNNRYLDGVSSMWCNLFGHNHPHINTAIQEQLGKVSHSTSLGLGNQTAATLAKRLADFLPGDLQHVFFASDGSSTVEAALKMAFQYWRQCENPTTEKNLYVALGQAYHGDSLGSSSVGGIERFHALFKPLLFDVVRIPSPDPRCITAHCSDEISATQYFLKQLEEVLAENHQQVAAIVLEPLIQAAAGIVFHPAGYLKGVRELADRYDVLLITDEIVTGFGRTGRMFACQHEDVVPDIMCLGKSLTGGYLPLSAAVATPKIYQEFLGTAESGRAFYHGHTYGGNQLCTAAALATLDLLENLDTDQFQAKSNKLNEFLNKLSNHPHVSQTRQKGLIAAIELTPDKATGTPYPAEAKIGQRVCIEARSRGLWIRPLRDVLVIMPPLSITVEELDFFANTLEQSIQAATASYQPTAKSE